MKNKSDVVENAKATKFDIQLKDWTNVKISAEVLIKVIAKAVSLSQWTNYKQKLENADIKVKIWDKIKSIDNSQLWRWSELMAFLQVAAWGNLTQDWKFGGATALAFTNVLKSNQATSTKVPESKITGGEDIDAKDFPWSYNAYKDFKNIFTEQVANQYRDTYQLFYNWYLKSFKKDWDTITINYKSQYNKLSQSLTFDRKKIKNSDENLDREKFIKELKTKLDNNEAKLKKENLKESVLDGIEEVDAKEFSSLIQEYLKDKSWITNWEIDFNSSIWNSGMEVKWDNLHITYPQKGSGWKNLLVTYWLSSVQTNNKFDQTKFVNVVSKTLNPRAKEWKALEFAETYNSLNKNPIWAIDTTKAADEKITDYKSLKNNIDKYSTLGVVVDPKVPTWIDKKISEIEKRKEYIKMKSSDESKVKWFEDFLNKKTPKTAWEQMAFQNEINSKKWEYKNFRDDFNKRVTSYIKISYTDRTNFNDRLKKIDKTYWYN